MTQYPIRSEEYRARALAEANAGAATPLAQVRAKHEQAARVWSVLAEQEEVRAVDRAARYAKASA